MKHKKKSSVTISMPVEMKEELTELAESRSMNRSAMILGMIKESCYADHPAEAFYYVELMDTLNDKSMNDQDKIKQSIKIINQLIENRRYSQE